MPFGHERQDLELAPCEAPCLVDRLAGVRSLAVVPAGEVDGVVERLPDRRGEVVRMGRLQDVCLGACGERPVDVLRVAVRREDDHLELRRPLLREREALDAVHLARAHLDARDEQAGTMLLDQCEGVVGRGRLPNDLDPDSGEDLLDGVQPKWMLVKQYCCAMLRRSHRKGRISIGLHEEARP
jgi:hypothetical protein